MDETRQLLKIFGVAVTDFEAEAEKLKTVAEQFTADTDKAEVAGHLKNVAELCREVNTRWLQVTGRVFEAQDDLLACCAEAAEKTL
ncbi:MAG: hypothetical protein MI757_16040 [Pirellulales bacterium]|nr:hypothetical protein [Pirellulales bacterium]